MTSSSKTPKSAAQRQALEQMKMEVAGEVGVNLKQGYNGDITSREAGSIGGGMVKKMYRKVCQQKPAELTQH